MRLETGWQDHVSMLHDFTQLGLQGKENLLCYLHSKTHHTAPKTGFVDCLNSLEAWFFLKKKSDFLACSPRFWLGISGVGPRNLHLLEESSDLNGNYSQTSRHSLMGHSNPVNPSLTVDQMHDFRQRYLNLCFLILQMVSVVCFSEEQDWMETPI